MEDKFLSPSYLGVTCVKMDIWHQAREPSRKFDEQLIQNSFQKRSITL